MLLAARAHSCGRAELKREEVVLVVEGHASLYQCGVSNVYSIQTTEPRPTAQGNLSTNIVLPHTHSEGANDSLYTPWASIYNNRFHLTNWYWVQKLQLLRDGHLRGRGGCAVTEQWLLLL